MTWQQKGMGVKDFEAMEDDHEKLRGICRDEKGSRMKRYAFMDFPFHHAIKELP